MRFQRDHSAAVDSRPVAECIKLGLRLGEVFLQAIKRAVTVDTVQNGNLSSKLIRSLLQCVLLV